jgi:hypothetical protein
MPRSLGIVIALTFAVLTGRVSAAHAVGIGGSCAGVAGLGCDAGLWCEINAGRCGNAAA